MRSRATQELAYSPGGGVSGADSLAPAIRRLVAMVENGSRPDAITRNLGRALLEPARRLLPEGITRLLIIPDGPLHHLPFDALVLADGKPALERWAIGLAPSASLAATRWRRETGPRSGPLAGRLLAMGDPQFPLELSPSAMRDGETMARTVAEMSGARHLLDHPDAWQAFVRDMERFLGQYYGRPLVEIQMASVVVDMLRLLRRHQVKANAAFTLVNMAIAVTEGIGRQLDPDLDVLSLALPFFAEAGLFAGGPPAGPPGAVA